MLKLEVHIIFTCHKILFFSELDPPQPSKNVKALLAHGLCKRRGWAGTGLRAVVCHSLVWIVGHLLGFLP